MLSPITFGEHDGLQEVLHWCILLDRENQTDRPTVMERTTVQWTVFTRAFLASKYQLLQTTIKPIIVNQMSVGFFFFFFFHILCTRGLFCQLNLDNLTHLEIQMLST